MVGRIRFDVAKGRAWSARGVGTLAASGHTSAMVPSRLVLASSSPRRRDLLTRLDLEFTVQTASIDETPLCDESPDEYVRRVATAKARAVEAPDAAVIAADTTVVVDGAILGKPDHPGHQATMLNRLSGRRHEVLTAVAVVLGPDEVEVGVERTTVAMSALPDERRAWYVATGEGSDKAGGYALQGAAGLFADRVEGSVSNVIGLPLPLLDQLCRGAGFDLLSFRRRR